MRNAILCGDVREQLRLIPDEYVHCVVTSPPYWGLRDYGAEGQIGLEATPEEYVQNMVEVFREIRRVLRKDGSVWLNLGDSYAANRSYQVTDNKHIDVGNNGSMSVPPGLKPKDLVGIPWRVAFALQADGWWLRSDIIWSKPNPMPESVTDRPTKAHEYIFLLTKSERYFYDADAIREPLTEWSIKALEGNWHRSAVNKNAPERNDAASVAEGMSYAARVNPAGRNKRTVWEFDEDEYAQFLAWKAAQPVEKPDVWTIATRPYAEAHFATYPEALVRPCILAGTSERGCCAECGAPWERVVERTAMVIDRSERTHEKGRTRSSGTMLEPPTSTTTGWRPTCKHDAPTKPAVILDPFLGSGTTALVTAKAGRDWIGIELSPEYVALAEKRLRAVKDRLL